MSEQRIRQAMQMIEAELRRTSEKFGPFASQHEGLAVIEEEFLELRNAVFWPHKGDDDPVVEATQLGAMAARFLIDTDIDFNECECGHIQGKHDNKHHCWVVLSSGFLCACPNFKPQLGESS